MGLSCPECESETIKQTNETSVSGYVRFKCGDCGHRTTNPDGLEEKIKVSTPEELSPVEEHRLKKQNKLLKRQAEELAEEALRQQERNAFVDAVMDHPIDPPKWLNEKKRGNDRAIATAMLSDTHFDEVVNPIEINGVNAYNREIATARLKNFFQNTISLAFDHCGGINIEGLVLAFGGDMVSGNIHEELAESNDAHIMDTVLYWSAQLIAGVELLLTRFDKIHIPGVTGNHGRNSRKIRAKGRAEDNFDYLIYKLVERHFARCKEVTFNIPNSSEARWSVYDTKYHMTHGDQFRGGNGIAGIFSPILRGHHKKFTREASVKTPYDILLMGHFHKLIDMGSVIVNGSLKGYDEWTASMNFDFEVPQQAFFLTDPKWGKTLTAPVHVLGKNENWSKPEFQVDWLK